MGAYGKNIRIKMKKVALFVPCYVDQFYPQVGIASLELLEKLGCEVVVPEGQTCCGQPLANSGCGKLGLDIEKHFSDLFSGFEYIVTPSASCALHVKEHFYTPGGYKNNVYEICEFVHRFCDYEKINANFRHRVGLHQGCHGLRGLRMGKSSELVTDEFSIVKDLLDQVQGLELVELERRDECCGFGGTFSVSEEAVSVMMGQDRVADHESHGAAFIVSTDMSCLMHLQGLMKREKIKMGIKHVVELLNEGI